MSRGAGWIKGLFSAGVIPKAERMLWGRNWFCLPEEVRGTGQQTSMRKRAPSVFKLVVAGFDTISTWDKGGYQRCLNATLAIVPMLATHPSDWRRCREHEHIS
ncbi:hypothetical protein BDQ17DRAFT_898041 [Cyathus striatus]|nr:hypothetical protein BDQ17DRAFT_898041 [Cyathus striatus]